MINHEKATLVLSKPTDLPRIEGGNLTFDTETNGNDVMRSKPFMPLIRYDGTDYALEWDDNFVDWFSDNAPNADNVLTHAGKFDAHMCIQGGVDMNVLNRLNIRDTMIREALIWEHYFTYNLDDCCARRDLVQKQGDAVYGWLAEKFGGKATRAAQIGRLWQAPREMAAYYGVGDLAATEALFLDQQAGIERDQLERVEALEHRVMLPLMRMERVGAPVDIEALPGVTAKVEEVLDQLTSNINKMAGFNLNANSGQQMERAFKNLGLPVKYNKPTPAMKKKNPDIKNGNPSFAKDVLTEINHPFTKSILEVKSVRKMLDSFLWPMPDRINPDTGRIHCTFNQTKSDDYGTVTGRLSCSNPNMQQIPKRNKKLAKIVRGLFAAALGQVWGCNDWSQQEYRMFAHYSKDQGVIDMYTDDASTDFHQAVADLTHLPRSRAKQINLGLVFGMGEGKLAKECGLPYDVEYVAKFKKDVLRAGPEAKEIFEQYHGKIPGAKRFMRLAANLAKKRGFVRTLFGRRIRFPKGMGTHKAGGLVFQGSAADLIKQKIYEVDRDREFHDHGGELVLTVHDELDWTGPEENGELIGKRVAEIMEDADGYNLRVPLKSDPGIARDWYTASIG